ncbi:MAG: flagellar basal body rod protein FlgB [Piscirickettsiaceae bacterium]|nr:MAG: flagellar basal body rod protein FlgB [Piscirickettsiaceae bacterium]
MATAISTLFGIHEHALKYRAQRAEVLASNMANADTPGYKARDFDFKSVLKQMDTGAGQLVTTHTNHIAVNSSSSAVNLAYRIPTSASLDGNTVDVQAEQARYGKNALDYQTSIRFLNGKISGYLSAIRGD